MVNTIVAAKERFERRHFLSRGARHEAGELIATTSRDALVVIISENRGISLVADGGNIVKVDL